MEGFVQGRFALVRKYACALVAAVALTDPGAAHAALIVDQSNLVPIGVGAPQYSGVSGWWGGYGLRQVQTVEAGATGLLSQVDLQMEQITDGTLRVSIYDGDYARAEGNITPPGSPGGFGVLIGSVDVPISTIPTLADANAGALLSLDVSSFGYYVHPGQVFSILSEVEGSDGTLGWSVGYTPSGGLPIVSLDYERGYDSATFYDTNFVQAQVDRGFRTWVESVPEPQIWALMICGFAMVGSKLRHRRRLVAC